MFEERLSTGVERLDRMLDGGYYRVANVLITGRNCRHFRGATAGARGWYISHPYAQKAFAGAPRAYNRRSKRRRAHHFFAGRKMSISAREPGD